MCNEKNSVGRFLDCVEFPCPGAPCDVTALPVQHIYHVTVSSLWHPALEQYNKSITRVVVANAIQEAKEAERNLVEALKNRQHGVKGLIELALIEACFMRCPKGHLGAMSDGCNHVCCHICGTSDEDGWCYSCGGEKDVCTLYHTLMDEDRDLLHGSCSSSDGYTLDNEHQI